MKLFEVDMEFNSRIMPRAKGDIYGFVVQARNIADAKKKSVEWCNENPPLGDLWGYIHRISFEAIRPVHFGKHGVLVKTNPRAKARHRGYYDIRKATAK